MSFFGNLFDFGQPSLSDNIDRVIFGPAYWDNPDLKCIEAEVVDDERRALTRGPTGLNTKRIIDADDYIWWGNQKLAPDSTEGHFLSLGMTRSGKSLLNNITMRSVIRNIRPGSDRRAVIFDTKGDVLRMLAWMKKAGELHVPVTILSLNDVRASAWDVAADCQRFDKAKDLATTFLPQQEGVKDAFWQDAARGVVTYTMQSLICHRGRQWRLDDLYNACLSSDEHLFEILRWFPRGSDIIRLLLHTDSKQTMSGIKSQLFTQLEHLSYAAAATQYADSLASLEKFLETEGILVITQDFTAREASNPYIRALFKRLVELITALEDSKTRKIFISLDECRFLGSLPKLLELVTFCGSKGVHCFISGQGREGLHELYGQGTAEEIFGQCEYKTFTNLDTPATAEWVTSLIGSVPVWEPVTTISTGRDGVSSSTQRQFRKRERVTPKDLVDLPLPDPQKGLWAYHRCKRQEPAFYATFLDARMIDQLSPQLDFSVPIQIPRPNDQLYVRPWSTAEREAFMKGVREDVDAAQSDDGRGSFARELAKVFFDIAEKSLTDALSRAWGPREGLE